MPRQVSRGKTSTKMRVNADGDLEVPVRADDGTPRVIVLQEPTLVELAKIHEAVAQADDQMPALPTPGLPPGADATLEARAEYLEQLRAYERASRERSVQMFGTDSPYGKAFIEIVSTLGEEVTGDQLYGWALNAKACKKVLEHFTAPLDGADEEPDLQSLWRGVERLSQT